jgi:hypothetical protein
MTHSDAELDLGPVLGEIARKWQRIHEHVHPSELTADEALNLLDALAVITDRLDLMSAPERNPVTTVINNRRSAKKGAR